MESTMDDLNVQLSDVDGRSGALHYGSDWNAQKKETHGIML